MIYITGNSEGWGQIFTHRNDTVYVEGKHHCLALHNASNNIKLMSSFSIHIAVYTEMKRAYSTRTDILNEWINKQGEHI